MKRGQWNCDKAEIVSSRARTGLKWEKQRDREEVNGDGVWWSGRQQISPDDFHFQRTNYSPSPRARSFVSAAFANKSASRNGCAATKSRPNPGLVKCPGPTVAIGWFWASRKSSTTPHPLFLELSLFSKVLFTGKCCEKRFSRSGRFVWAAGETLWQAERCSVMCRIISLLLVIWHERIIIWDSNRLFEVCYEGTYGFCLYLCAKFYHTVPLIWNILSELKRRIKPKFRVVFLRTARNNYFSKQPI